ncbi:tRNA synthetase class I [Nemania sp. NC0429]|nr:tRNA synthetase class I [Nemania sp. NC0429]
MSLWSPAPSGLCRSCLLRRLAVSRQQHRRPLHLSTIAKRKDAEEAWNRRAEEIKNGQVPHLWDTFKARGLVKDVAGTDDQIRELMRRKRIGAYVGIDPTAPSLHLGHLLPLMPLFWMYMHGYRAITVVGGATAKAGDPTGRLQTRDEVSKADRTRFTTKIHYQLKSMWRHVEQQAAHYGYQKEWAWNREIVNNSAWHNSTSFSEVVQRLFTKVRVGPMLARETAKRKMTEGDGMSLAEFVYPLMQAWDFWKMFVGPKDVCMQIGGSDQYGNIVAGVDAVKLLRDTEKAPDLMRPNDLLHTPVGFTVPLLTDASGNKFGKSAGNALWLDPFMTNSFDLYGYFMRRPDAEVEKLLKLFTFIPLEQIDQIMAQHNLDPPKRHAHHALALEVLALVHGRSEAVATQERHRQMFANPGTPPPDTPLSRGELASYPAKGTPAEIALATQFRPDIELPESLILGQSIARILFGAGLAESGSDAHRLIAHQGAYVGGSPGRSAQDNMGMVEGDLSFTPVKNWFPGDTKNFLIDGKLLILRRGKFFVRIVKMISDKEWEASGQSYPGEPGKGAARQLRQALMDANGGKDPKIKGEELVRLKEKLDSAGRGESAALEDADTVGPPKIKFPQARPRARRLLNKFGALAQLTPERRESLTVKEKTMAIDRIIKSEQAMEFESKMARAMALERGGPLLSPLPSPRSTASPWLGRGRRPSGSKR